MALLALHLLVQAGQRIARLVVVELSGSVLPVDEVVALDAIRSEPSFMEVLVAGGAGLRDPQEGPAQVLHLDAGALRGGYPLGQMELVRARVPLDQGKVHAVVVGVATHAILAGAGRDVVGPVQTLLRRHPRANVSVALDALEDGLAAADLVAVGAMGRAIQKLMGPRQGPGRDLRARADRQETQEACGRHRRGGDRVEQAPAAPGTCRWLRP